MMKDGLGGKIMREFVVLRAKIYEYRKLEDKPFKGTKKWVLTKSLSFDDYMTCLFNTKTISRKQMLFQNKKQEMYMVNKHKIEKMIRGTDK